MGIIGRACVRAVWRRGLLRAVAEFVPYQPQLTKSVADLGRGSGKARAGRFVAVPAAGA